MHPITPSHFLPPSIKTAPYNLYGGEDRINSESEINSLKIIVSCLVLLKKKNRTNETMYT